MCIYISMYIQYIVIISHWKRAWSLIWNLNPLYPRMLCAKFGWNWRRGSGEEDFQISSIYFRSFVIISPEKGRGPSFEQTWISLHPKMLCAMFGWNCTHGSREEDENVKRLRTDTQTTDDRQSEKLTGAFSSGELKYTVCVCSSSHLGIFCFFERARKII